MEIDWSALVTEMALGYSPWLLIRRRHVLLGAQLNLVQLSPSFFDFNIFICHIYRAISWLAAYSCKRLRGKLGFTMSTLVGRAMLGKTTG